jgi:hypothetical protein
VKRKSQYHNLVLVEVKKCMSAMTGDLKVPMDVLDAMFFSISGVSYMHACAGVFGDSQQRHPQMGAFFMEKSKV